MLRASIEAAGSDLDVRAITDPAVDPLVEGGMPLIRFVDAVLTGDEVRRAAAADDVAEALGDTALADAAGVIATFEMMNRIADATGLPVGRGRLQATEEFRRLTGVDRFRHD